MKLLLLLTLTSWFHVTTARNVCIEGFVMDKYCIDLGVLLDNKSVKTLENPELHSVHCLVDVSVCYNSGFNVLLPNPTGSPAYVFALRLDSVGNKKVIDVARAHGKDCSTCTTNNGTVKQGFRATIFGKITSEATATTPTEISVTDLKVSPKIANPNGQDDGCPGGADSLNVTLFTGAGSLKTPSIAHGSLMIISWGFLLPTGVLAARLLKHRPDALWFKMHRIVQIFGLLVAICGWVIALAKFSVFESPGDSRNHGIMGMTVMVLGILQPLNALVRPHPPEAGEARPLKRLMWEIVHKSSGYIACVLAAGTILYGTFVIFGHQKEFRAAWGISLAWLLVFSAYCLYDGYKYSKRVSSNTNARYNKSELE